MRTTKEQRPAVVAGATGLIGSEVVERLLSDARWRRVIALSRRPLPLRHERLQAVDADYDRLDDRLTSDRAVHPLDVFCCLGTTIRTAGSQDAFRRVDHDYVLALGEWARAAGAHRMVVVSALGADPKSTVFYNRVKGETERDLQALGLSSLVFVRPSLLLGKREELRVGERLAQLAAGPVRGLLPQRIRPILAADVAQAMIDAAWSKEPEGVIESGAMQGAARG